MYLFNWKSRAKFIKLIAPVGWLTGPWIILAPKSELPYTVLKKRSLIHGFDRFVEKEG
jgi:hypothetical protein